MLALFGSLLVLTLLKFSESTCSGSKMLCFCGNTNVTVSIPCNATTASSKNPCHFLASCETCADNFDRCITCPKGLKGPLCDKEDDSWLPPGSRLFPRDVGRIEGKGSGRFSRDTSCSKLRSPVGGLIRCSYSTYLSECTASCIPGFSFEGHGEQIKVTCQDGEWTPTAQFPPCKSGGDCDLEVIGEGSYNCTYGVQGTSCDIHCNGRGGRYSCFPGRQWSPPLPHCVTKKGLHNIKEDRECGCRNGGTCDQERGICTCPPNFQGNFCETPRRRNTQTSAPPSARCPDPGRVENAERINPDGRSISPNSVFYPGSAVVYNCNPGYALLGKTLLTCTPASRWSSAPPTCNRVHQSGKTTTESPDEIAYCDDPGINPNAERRLSPWLGPRSLVQDLSSDKYPQGFQMDYSCKQGYTLVGANSLICLVSGIWSTRLPRCERTPVQTDCGLSFMQTRRKITHGEKTSEGDWPWQVAIVEPTGDKLDLFCGGVVIDHRTVVTAAHCIQDKKPQQILLYFGKHFLDYQKDDKEVSVRTPSEFIIHPDFNRRSLDADIAIIKFSPDILFTGRVQPICLPSTENTRIDIVAGSSGLVTGWGLTEKNVQPDVLLVAEIPVVPTRTCRRYYVQKDVLFQLTRNMFCGGYRTGKVDSCQGDSGGPMVFYDDVNRRYVLEGLVSFGVTSSCGEPEWYAVYTKVGNFVGWIRQNI